MINSRTHRASADEAFTALNWVVKGRGGSLVLLLSICVCSPSPTCRGLLCCLEASALPRHSGAAHASPPSPLSLPQAISSLLGACSPILLVCPLRTAVPRGLGDAARTFLRTLSPQLRKLAASPDLASWPPKHSPGSRSRSIQHETPGNTDSIHSSLDSFCLHVARLLSAYWPALGLLVQTSYSHPHCPW